ncbi:MAG: TonB-dependent receptor [Proteobacteria bacterium]|nr:TonB-dependent receptor [Pseudomonadota bacterium]
MEILRGPQGTLFGAGSEGGTVRFIMPEPPLAGQMLYARAEFSDTAHGAPGFEYGAAAGGALIEDRLGLRMSASLRRDGGYVDRIDWHRRAVSAADSNSAVTRTARIALKWAVGETLWVTPSFFYQQRRVNDTAAFWALVPGSADPTRGQFDAPLRNGNATANPSTDAFALSTLRLNWDIGSLRLTSNTSYFDRRQSAVTDYAEYDRAVFLGNPFAPAGVVAPTSWADEQRNWTQELRLESQPDDARIAWTAGIFAQRAHENTVENVFDPALVEQLRLASYGGGYVYYQDPFSSVDTQLAVFGQADWHLDEHLKLTLGLRFTHARFEGEAFFAGPVVGQPVYSRGRQIDNPFTPKLGLSWTPSGDDLFYATLAKGYRIGGANAAVGQLCEGGPDSALGSIGLTRVAPDYAADSVWSYEIGAKLARDERRLLLDASLYWISWADIQQAVPLTACGFQFVANLGQARSRGLDLQFQYRWNDALTLGLSGGFTDAVYTRTVRLAPSALSLVQAGDHLVASPWMVSMFAEARRPAGSWDAYARMDFQYAARQNGTVPTMNPLDGGNPDWFAGIPAQSTAGLRMGARGGGWDIALTAQNLFDRQPRLTINQDVGLGAGGTPLLYIITARPRTLGLAVTYHYRSDE